MDARKIQILEHFEANAATIHPLFERIPKSSVYRLIRSLVEHGCRDPRCAR